MTSDVLIRAEGLSKCYQIYDQPRDRLFQFISRGRRQYFREFWALRDASFAIGRGESVGIIGRNGSGKSTLLQLIAGTLTPTGGSLEIQGRISALLELGSGFNPDFTGRENVHINAAILGLDAMDIQQRFAEIEAFADIGDFMDQPVKTYSSGMLMRLAFAVTVCSDPQILIVDEALAVGDAAFQFKCLDRLGKLIETGTTLLFVSHDLALVKTYCKNAVYLRQGELVFFGPVEQAAEVYLQDLRAAQRKDLATDSAGLVVKKPPLSEGGLAFGTGLGRIVRVAFQGHEGRHELVEYGTRLVIEAEIEYGPDVRSPKLAIAIADRRNVVVAGKFSQILPAARDGWKKARLSFDFLAALGEGHYSISVVLEDKPGTMQGLLVEKQANALVFDMLPPPDDQAFLGALDLGIKIESQELE